MGGRITGMFTGAQGKQKASAIAGPGHMYQYDKGYLDPKEHYEKLKGEGKKVRQTTKAAGLGGGKAPMYQLWQDSDVTPGGGGGWTEIQRTNITPFSQTPGRYNIVKDPDYVAPGGTTTTAAVTSTLSERKARGSGYGQRTIMTRPRGIEEEANVKRTMLGSGNY